MKKIILLLALTMLSVTSFAQTPKITAKWEATFNKNFQKDIYDFRFLHEDETSYYILIQKAVYKLYPGKVFVEKYDKATLKPIASKEIASLAERYIHGIYPIGGKAYVHIGGISSGLVSKGSHIFARFNAEKMDVELLSFPDINFKELNTIVATPDSSAFLLSFINLEEKDKSTVKPTCRLMLVDRECNKIWQKDMTTPFMSHFAFTIDNDQNIYISGREYADKNNYNYAILKLSGKDLNKQAEKMPLNDMLYQQCRIFTDKNNVSFAVGFCSDKIDLTKTGSFYFSLKDDFKQKENFKFTAIPLDYLKYNHNQYKRNESQAIEKNKEDVRYADYDVYEIFYADNGDVILCTEECGGWWVPVGTSSSKAYYQAYQDIYVFRINTNSGLMWVKRVPKYQKNNFLSNTAFLIGDDVVLLFNDNKDNVTLNENSEPVLADGIPVDMSVILDKNGNQKRQIVNFGTTLKFYPKFTEYTRLSNDKVFITQDYKEERKVGVISVAK